MPSARNTERIIEVLDLLNNEQRPATINSYILYIISSLSEASLQEIITFTQVEFEINLESDEVTDSTNHLLKDGQLILIGEKYRLTDAAKASMIAHVDACNQQEYKIKENFQKNVSFLTEDELSVEDIDKLFKEFKGYIHENFFYYGKSAINILNGSKKNQQNLTSQQIFKIYFNNLPVRLRKIFSAYIETLAANSTSLELEYYESLADRAEHFFALGLSKELAEELASIQPINWTIFLDTNFLFSALRIHANTENPAVSSLLNIIRENKEYFKAKLYYLKPTYKELLKIRPVLNELVSNQKLTQNQIQAALRSDNLDSYTKAYYENQLIHGQASHHPSTIVDNAIQVLRSKGVEIYNGEVKGVDPESPEFTDAISDYNKYQSMMNEVRLERNALSELRFKNTEQLEHDIYLRESILSFRERSDVSTTYFQDCNTFGLTLDFGLVAYDKYIGRRDNGQELFIPAFFTPSYLLKKLYKLLPVASDDYRKAFLSSIASPVFTSSDQQKSVDSQSALAAFHALGIDDTSIITKSLTSKIFLDEIKNAGGDIEKIKPFIESEISKELKSKAQKEKKLAKDLKSEQENLAKTATAYNDTLQTNSELADTKTLLEQKIDTLTKGLKSNKKTTDRLQALLIKIGSTPQPQLPFGNEQDRQEIERLKNIVQQKEEAEIASAKQKAENDAKAAKSKEDDEVNRRQRIWQRNSLLNLAIPLVLLVIFGCYVLSLHHWSLSATIAYISGFKNDATISSMASSITTLVLFIYNGIFIKIAYDRCLNKSNIKSYRELLREQLRSN